METIERVRQARLPRPITWLQRFDRRSRMIAATLVALSVALYFGWGWLAAAGLTGLIIGFLPCAAMCGLGLCANRFMGKSGGSGCHAGSKEALPETKAAAAGQDAPPPAA